MLNYGIVDTNFMDYIKMLNTNEKHIQETLKKLKVGRDKKSFLYRKYGLNSSKKRFNSKIKFCSKICSTINSSAAVSTPQEFIDFLKEAKTYKGLRHKFGYPCRGQRTHTNGKTSRKKNIFKKKI